MTYLVLALKWRPQRFADVVGQEPVSRTLSNALKTGRAAQAYLFTGPRGVGKTSMARILAKALNCAQAPADEPCNDCPACREITAGRSLDVMEIDGASNRGIDDIRELREKVRYAPASLTRKVYIIDEVHMLTQDAFNALLKTLEEPPAHVVFVLATTEPLKVPQTILSRCQRFDFARLGARTATKRLRQICDAEKVAADDEALFLLARKAEGSMRDALTLLDQVLAGGPERLTLTGVREALGVAGRELFFEWTEAIAARDPARALRSLSVALESGANLLELADEFLVHLRNLLYLATDASLSELVEATEEEVELYRSQASRLASADLLRCCRLSLESGTLMRRSGVPRAHLEIALAEMCSLPTALDLRRFIEATRGRLEEGTSSSAATAASSTSPQPSSGSSPSLSAPAAAGLRPAKAGRARSVPTAQEPPESPEPPASLELPASREVPASPEVSAASKASDSALDDTADPWTRALQAVVRRRSSLGATLSGSVVLGEEDRILRVGVPGLTAFQRGQLEKNANRQLIMERIAESYGRPLGVRFEETAPAAPPESAEQGSDGVKSRRGPTASSEGVRRIADLFDGDVVGPA